MVTNDTHALFHAIECKNHQMVVLLIDKGLNVDLTDNKGKTALMYAIEAKMYDTVKFLIQRGADIYKMDDAFSMAEDYAKVCHSDMIRSHLKYIIYLDMNVSSHRTQPCKCG